MTAGLDHLLGKTQVAVESVQHRQPRPPHTMGRRRQPGQQGFRQGRFTGFAIEMAHHRHRQTRPQVQAHRRTRTQDTCPQVAQRLEQSLDMLDRLAVRAKDFEIRKAVRQGVNRRGRGQERAHPPGAFFKQGLAQGHRQVPELLETRGDRRRQRLGLPTAFEGLTATAAVLQQGFGDEMGQRTELEFPLVAASARSRPEVVQPAIVHCETQRSPRRVGQGYVLKHCGGKNDAVHNEGTPEESSNWCPTEAYGIGVLSGTIGQDPDSTALPRGD